MRARPFYKSQIIPGKIKSTLVLPPTKTNVVIGYGPSLRGEKVIFCRYHSSVNLLELAARVFPGTWSKRWQNTIKTRI